MQGYRQQQAQSMERIARAAETQRAAEAQRAASAPQPRRDLPRTNPEALRAPAASQPAPGPSQQKQALAPAAQPQATTPAKSSGSNKPKSEQVATASRGQARAWCMRKNSSEFECLGPFQKGWGTLKRALEMSGCSNGSGYTPTLGTGGQSFNCGRELHSYEKAVPTYDPFRTR
jgi:hypothetical protein